MDPESLFKFIRMQAFFTALPFGFGLLHLILYAYLREQQSNLFYAAFLMTFGATVYFDFEASYVREGTVSIVMLQLRRLWRGKASPCDDMTFLVVKVR